MPARDDLRQHPVELVLGLIEVLVGLGVAGIEQDIAQGLAHLQALRIGARDISLNGELGLDEAGQAFARKLHLPQRAAQGKQEKAAGRSGQQYKLGSYGQGLGSHLRSRACIQWVGPASSPRPS
ncbi:MAG: hypothetical protein RBT67_00775 [Thauera sp.]|nr:hypothetical protein [Thauera sp.]